MKRHLAFSAFALMIATGLALPAQAQQGGQISAISGQGLIHHDGAAIWSPAWPGEALTLGDAVTATPGSHLRLMIGDAQIALRPGAEMDWAGQNGLMPLIRQDQGVSEITLPADDWNSGLSVITPWGLARLEQPGAYRLSRHDDGTMRMVVWQGRADLPAFGLTLWPGQQALLSNQGAAVSAAQPPDDDYSRNGYGYTPPPAYAPAPVPAMPPMLGGIIIETSPRRHHDEPNREEQRQGQQQWQRQDQRPGQQQGQQQGQHPDQHHDQQRHDQPRPQPQPQPAPQPHPQPQPAPAPAPAPAPQPAPQQPHPQPPHEDPHQHPKTGPSPAPAPVPPHQ